MKDGFEMKRLAVVTMVFNERNQLPRWVRHYSKHVDELTDIFVIDHGSTDGSIEMLPPSVNIIRLQRFDVFGGYQSWRVDYVSQVITKLLDQYDAAVYVDCDEYLVVNPSKAASLVDYVEKTRGRLDYTNSAIGFDVLHDHEKEQTLGDNLISTVRNKILFVAAMCKPVLIRNKNIKWGPGFHVSNQIPVFCDLFLFHLRYGDISEGLSRLKTTRDIDRPEMKNVPCDHHKLADDMYLGWVSSWLQYNFENTSILDGSCTIYKALSDFNFQVGSSGLINFDYSFRSTTLYAIPVEFNGHL